MRSSLASISVLASGWHGDFHRCWQGLLMSVVIAIASTFIAEQRGGPTLLYALLLAVEAVFLARAVLAAQRAIG